MPKDVITIELNPKEISMLLDILEERQKRINQLSFTKVTDIGLTEKLVKSLNKEEREATIEELVKSAIFRQTGISTEAINNDSNLTDDLLMTSIEVRSLATAFTAIARKFKSGVSITSDECENQSTVQDCINLIIEKI